MGGCAAINCTNNSRKGFRMHSFPSDRVRSRFWAQQCGRIDDWIPTKTFFLCEAHFDQNQYELYRADGRKLLKWNAIPTIFNFQKPIGVSTKREFGKNQKKIQSKKKNLSKVENLSNAENCSNLIPMENISSDMTTTEQDISDELIKITAENVSCQLHEVTKEKVSRRKCKITQKSLRPYEVLDDVTYTLHSISPENFSTEMDYLRENISCNLQQNIRDEVNFDIYKLENVPVVLDDCDEEDVCELEECRKGCTHKTIIENYKIRILKLEDQLASMKNELNASKTKLKSKARKKRN